MPHDKTGKGGDSMDRQENAAPAVKKGGPVSQIVLRVVLGILYLLLNIVFYVVVFLVAKNLCKDTYHYAYQIFGNVSVAEAPGTDVSVTIEPGQGTMDVALMLERNRIVVNRYTFFIRTKLTIGKEHPIFPGTYTLNTSMCYDDILKIITDPTQNTEDNQDVPE